MKKCPYCAEEIQDEAIKCRYCQSDLTVPVGQEPPVAGPPTPDRRPPASPGWEAPPSQPPTTQPPVAQQPAPSPGWPQPASSPTWQAGTAPSTVQPAAQPAPAGPRVGEGALRFSHSGTRYILGFGADYFGIWDREQPGPAILRFARTNQGWDEAWNRFTAWEPRSMEVPAQGVAPGWAQSFAARPYRPTKGLTQALTALLVAMALVQLLAIAFRLQYISILRGIEIHGSPSGDVTSAVDRLNAVAGIVGVLLLASAVVWLMWQSRSHSDLPILGSSGLRFTPGWTVGWWFVPFANVVQPYRAMSELWRASEPAAGAVEWKALTSPPVMWFWWAGWLGASILSLVASSLGPRVGQTYSLHQHLTREWVQVADAIVYAVDALLAVVVVRGIEARQRSKLQRSKAWAQSFGPA